MLEILENWLSDGGVAFLFVFQTVIITGAGYLFARILLKLLKK